MAQTGLKTQHTDSSPPPQAPLKSHKTPCTECVIPLSPELRLLHARRALPIPSNSKGLTQFQLSIRKFARGIIMNAESKEAALAGYLLPNGTTG